MRGGAALVDEEVGQVLRDGDGGARVRDGLIRVRVGVRVRVRVRARVGVRVRVRVSPA